ncbi:restriction endonuclease family protein [Lyngbya aestuarii BL J]|uniref:Restriction endonuclease family protein n=1 Tax=Lyngbya aestuarii BL J TaxID=1348334 RepID=U7QEA1_9CYAN|nr:Uma2 family endonuclease [Lyngbya aestuarii]ERT06218.1 restriction endonuclease family protein [Lyngbya aestuarii BL J]
MVSRLQESYTISHKDYLEGEKVSQIKHEYIRGEVYAMAGGSDAHETIAGNLFVLLRNHVRGQGCRAYIGNMKVQIEAADVYYYPDLFVTCDSRDQNPDDFKKYPRLIVEVLSPSTEAFNRGNKFADYRQIETLEEYILISQDQINVECFRRNEQGFWVLYPYNAEDELELSSIGFKCAIRELYEDVLGFS